MNRKSLFAALACALLVFSMLGCGATNKLQSIQISSSSTAETVTGTMSIGIDGPTEGPVQLYVWGNYSNGKAKLLNGEGIQYQISVDPGLPYGVSPDSGEFYLLSAPPETLQVSTTGLLTAVEPIACSWFNSAVAPATAPAWGIVGQYVVTATDAGLTTPPVYVAMSSAVGVFNATTNPTGECGPSSSQ